MAAPLLDALVNTPPDAIGAVLLALIIGLTVAYGLCLAN
jgi:hypothetical protein